MKQILLIEDDALLAPLYMMLLQDAGFSVTVTIEAKKIFSHLKQSHFDLILLDMMLPTISGQHLLPKILARVPAGNIVMLSNLHQPQLQKACLESGARDYWIKSDLTPDTFIALVEEVM